MATVRIIYQEGESNEFIFPYVFHVSDNSPGMKSTTIRGNRGDGSLVIPGGKSSIEIKIRGKIIEDTGYEAITTKMNEMRTKINTASATLKMQHYSGGSWINDWAYTCRRINEIRFPQSLRSSESSQEYQCDFLVTSY